MGILGFGNNGKEITLKKKIEEFMNRKREEIVQYFNSFDELTQPNDPTQNKDKAIDKVYYEEEGGYKYIFHIFNIPGIFRMNNGLFQMIGENLMIFQLFFNKYSDLNEENLRKQFEEFFNALLEVDADKINKMLQIKIEECELIKKKKGLEFLMDMFGYENIKTYYLTIILTGIGTSVLASTGILLTKAIIDTITFPPVGLAIGVVIIIGVISFFIYRNVSNNHNKIVCNNFLKLKQFFDDTQNFLSSGVYYLCEDGDKNLFVIAIKKKKNIIEEICILPHYIIEITSTNCPTLGNNPLSNSNAEYYKTVLDACNFYIKKFSSRINNHINGITDYYLQKDIEEVFNWLKKATMAQIKEKIYAEEIQKIKDAKQKNEAYDIELPRVPSYVSIKTDFSNNEHFKRIKLKEKI